MPQTLTMIWKDDRRVVERLRVSRSPGVLVDALTVDALAVWMKDKIKARSEDRSSLRASLP